MNYNPFDWYWADNTGRVFSSKLQNIVAAGDATYQTWLAAGNVATIWPKDNDGNQTTLALQQVLTPCGLFADLPTYANAKQSKIMGGGIIVNIGTIGAPINVEASTDTRSMVLLHGATTIAATAPSQTFQWVPSVGTPLTLTAAQMTAIFDAVSIFLQATFTTLSGVINAINAGTITTQAQVDTPPTPIPAWPANS